MKVAVRILSGVFLLFWILFVFADYWQKHPVYFYSFKLFDYWGFTLFLSVLGAALVWSVRRFRSPRKGKGFLNGLSLFVLFMVISVASVAFAFEKLVPNGNFDLAKAMKIFGSVAWMLIALYFITLTCYVLGNWLNELIGIGIKPEDRSVLDITSGIMTLTMALFLLGAVSLLYVFVVLPLMLVVLLWRWKTSLSVLKASLWQPLAVDKGWKATGLLAFFLIITFLSINLTAVNVPMPTGFDTLTLYANLPVLISDHHSLVPGFQPYSWSVFMSLGHLLFKSTPIVLALSYLGGALALYATYVLGRSWLGLDVNTAMIAVLAFSFIPVFSGQMYGELKIDLGLLFIYLSIVLLLLNFFKADEANARRKARPEIVLTGLLTGFALGVKLTTIYFIFALLCALWYRKAATRGLFAAFLVSLFLVFFLKIDEMGGLRRYHIGVDALQWGVLLAGIFLFAGIYASDKKAWLAGLRNTIMLVMFVALMFFPWVVKNYVDTRSLNPRELLSGKEAAPEINLQILEQNQQQSNH